MDASDQGLNSSMYSMSSRTPNDTWRSVCGENPGIKHEKYEVWLYGTNTILSQEEHVRVAQTLSTQAETLTLGQGDGTAADTMTPSHN